MILSVYFELKFVVGVKKKKGGRAGRGGGGAVDKFLTTWRMLLKFELPRSATTSRKNVETLRRKNYLSCLKSLQVTGLWDVIMIFLLPPIQSCSLKLWALSCIATNFHKGRRRDHKHKNMDRPFTPKYGTLCQVLLQLVVAWVARFSYLFAQCNQGHFKRFCCCSCFPLWFFHHNFTWFLWGVSLFTSMANKLKTLF